MLSNADDDARGPQVSSPADGALDSLEAAVAELRGCRLDAMNTRQRVSVLTAIIETTRRLADVENQLIAGLCRESIPAELAGGVKSHLAMALRITPAEAGRRVKDAEDVGPRTSVTGEPLSPRLAATAAGVANGRLDREHVREIRRFLDRLPAVTPAHERERAEAFLAEIADELSPDQLRRAADQLATEMGREDEFSDVDRARRRGFTWSHQDADGMSKGVLWATPQLRAEFDAIFAAAAAPGKCNPNDESPCVDGVPEPAQEKRDNRTPAQRKHDALSAVSRAMLASGKLGQHNGLPVTVVVTTTLQDLEAGAGVARTGGGTALPVRDLIRMATHAFHYLAVFDKHTNEPLYLGRSRRTASPGQRIVLHALDRGCTFPGCDRPGYLSQAHHAVADWVDGGLTNIDELTFACTGHHPLVTSGGWTTRKNAFGHTEWIPPPQLEMPCKTNKFHHPERYLGPQRQSRSAKPVAPGP